MVEGGVERNTLLQVTADVGHHGAALDLGQFTAEVRPDLGIGNEIGEPVAPDGAVAVGVAAQAVDNPRLASFEKDDAHVAETLVGRGDVGEVVRPGAATVAGDEIALADVP